MLKSSHPRIGGVMSQPRMRQRLEAGVCGLTRIRSILMIGGKLGDDQIRLIRGQREASIMIDKGIEQ